MFAAEASYRRRVAHILTEQALQVPAISMMVRTVTRDIASVDGTRQVLLRSTNELLLDPDINGVKTGYTSKAGEGTSRTLATLCHESTWFCMRVSGAALCHFEDGFDFDGDVARQRGHAHGAASALVPIVEPLQHCRSSLGTSLGGAQRHG